MISLNQGALQTKHFDDTVRLLGYLYIGLYTYVLFMWCVLRLSLPMSKIAFIMIVTYLCIDVHNYIYHQIYLFAIDDCIIQEYDYHFCIVLGSCLPSLCYESCVPIQWNYP